MSEEARKGGRPPAPPFDWRAPPGTTVCIVKCPACGLSIAMRPSDKGRLSGICPHAYGDQLEPCNSKVFFGAPKSRDLTAKWRAAHDPQDKEPPTDGKRSFLGY
ncbi:MAG: hypothetical protein GC186_16475 [Rhodobacteraceae bacterium]|nr:hypothetical protein [Paracoccaceae bacterium]